MALVWKPARVVPTGQQFSGTTASLSEAAAGYQGTYYLLYENPNSYIATYVQGQLLSGNPEPQHIELVSSGLSKTDSKVECETHNDILGDPPVRAPFVSARDYGVVWRDVDVGHTLYPDDQWEVGHFEYNFPYEVKVNIYGELYVECYSGGQHELKYDVNAHGNLTGFKSTQFEEI